MMIGDAKIYTFTKTDGSRGYLPVVPVIKDYLRHERRKADNALAEFLTLTHLNGIAKYRPHHINTTDPAREREIVKNTIFNVLDTRNEPLRHNPEGLLERKVAGLAMFAVYPSTPAEYQIVLSLYDVEQAFIAISLSEEDGEEGESDDDSFIF